ncbi:MAG: tRNA (guanosine(37)-N1)-methyltransferase TrmD [Desulfobacterales bacterium]|nr:tRNA (guanosine(37)-N1)-methyltransferase TrmD [Desulfobacterales bacterium]
MNFAVLTIFPEMFESFWNHGIVRRAVSSDLITAATINIRDYAQGRHRVTDDRPYGGGCGMVMKPEPLAAAIVAARSRQPESRVVLLSPQGRPFDQPTAEALATESGLILVCGRYEGVDERICQDHIDLEISIGDYVLTGGELAAMVVVDAVTRLIPGSLGGEDSADLDSFSTGLLEHAHYTRPRTFADEPVPDVLLSGNHKEIEDWRLETSLIRTFLKRQDLLEQRPLTPRETEILKNWCQDLERIICAQSEHRADPLSGR